MIIASQSLLPADASWQAFFWRREMDSNHHEQPDIACQLISALPRPAAILRRKC